ncbi:MAG: hypothetical protein HY903_08215 [Deltaproteobacteria bacterium]|nr:hypothetical protein [Deltaproteobacteria bacterium]
MNPTPLQPLLSSFVTQTAVDAGANVTVALALVGAAAVIALAVVVMRLRAAERALKALSVEHQSTTEAHRALLDKERKQAKELEARRDELKELKTDLGQQRKKGHNRDEETKSLRAEVKRLSEELDRTKNSRPAFEDKPQPSKIGAAAKPPAEPKPKATEDLKAKPAPEAVAPPAPSVAVEPKAAEVAARLERLEAENQRLRETLAAGREDHAGTERELAALRKRVESLRRIDVVTKSKTEVLEDRVRGLGRQYYEAVSELALLKGEVVPPKPRDLEAAPSAPATDDADLDQTHDTAEGPTLAAGTTADGEPSAKTRADA